MRKRVLAGLIEALYGSVVRWVWWQRAAVRCGNRAQRRHAARERARKLRRWYARTPIRLPGRIEFEALEPRVVLSGDLNPVGAAIVAQDVAAQHFTLPAENAGPAIILGPVVEGQPLTVADGDGTEVTFTLNGAGTGEVSATAEGFDVSVTGSTTASALAVTTTGGDGRANLHNLNVTESLQSFSGATLDLTGDILVSGTLSTLNLGNIGAAHQATILGTGVALQFIAGNVVDLSMNVASPIASLNVQSWQDLDGVRDVIRAPSIGTLVSAGNFNASLDLTGAATGFTLTSATIGGMVNGGQWSITGRVNQVIAQSTGPDWRLNASSALSFLNVTQTLSGQISSPSIQLIQVGGDLAHATIYAGANLGTDVALGGTGSAADVFTKGTLARLRVTGQVIDSQIYVGVDPKNGQFNDGDDEIVPGSSIQELIVGQSIDDTSQIVAGVFPATVRVNGVSAPPSTFPALTTQPPDAEAPSVTAALANDTGASNADAITHDATVTGQVNDLGTITLRARLDAIATFTDVTSKLQTDQSFVLDGVTLNTLAGGVLQDGPHVVHLQAVDGGGNVGSFDLAFTIDTQAPATPNFDLAAASDTAPVGDQQTTAALVTLEGATDPQARVILVETGAQTTPDGGGSFHFDGIALTLGANAFTVRATDVAGNTAEAARTITRVAVGGGDNEAPVIVAALTNDTGASNLDGITQDASIAGTLSDASAIASFKAGFDATPVGSFFDIFGELSNGQFTMSMADLNAINGGPLADGAHVLHFLASDASGNPGGFDVAFTLDTAKPNAPTLTLDQASDSGASNNDGVTNDATPTLNVAGEAGSTLALFKGGVATGDTVIGPTGQITANTLVDDSHSFTATATDLAGNASDASSALNITIDTLAPVTPNFDLAAASDSAPVGDQQTTAALVTLEGTTDSQARVRLVQKGAETIADGSGAFHFDAIALALGANAFTVRATDTAGNTAEAARTITRVAVGGEDNEAPVIAAALTNDTGASNLDGITQDASIAGTITDASAIASFTAGFDATPVGDFFDISGELSNGQFALSMADLNTINGGPLADGTHVLHLLAVDASGNPGGFEVAFTLDTAPPPAPAFDLAPASDTAPVGDQETTLATVTLAGQTEPGMLVTLVETGAQVTASGEGAFAFTGVSLALGANTFTARATDLAGNEGEAALTVTRQTDTTQDLAPPVITAALANDTGTSSADQLTSDATIAGSVIDESSGIAMFRAGLDGTQLADFSNALFALEADGSFTLTAAFLDALAGGTLADGAHTLHLVATDAQDNQSDVVDVAFTLDTLAPGLAVTAPGNGATIEPGARLTGTVDSTAVAVNYRFDDLAPHGVAVGTGGAFDQVLLVAGLGNGPHVLTATATDLAGNTATAAIALTLEGIPFALAEHTPLDGADGVVIDVRPTIVFSGPVDAATVSAATFFAEAGGTTLPANVVVDRSGRFARLFFTDRMPGGAEVRVTIDGSAILAAADGTPLDADRDGEPGGLFTFAFITVSTVALPGTALSGRLADAGPDLEPLTADDTLPGPDGQLGTPDDVILTPIAGARIFVRGLEDDFVLTGVDGAFHLDAVPGGTVALALQAETASAPPGFTYPKIAADLQMTVGIDNPVRHDLHAAAGQRRHPDGGHQHDDHPDLASGGRWGLTEEQRQQFTLEIPPGSLLGPDGQPVGSAQVLMSVVPTGVRPLPPTVPEPVLAFTVQFRGATDVGGPVRMTLPNLSGAPVGTEFQVVSFDPTTGQFVGNGVARVAASFGPSVLAATGDGHVIAQVGEAIEWELTLEPGNMGVCFHFVIPGSSVGPSDCEPGVPATQFVFPVFLDEDTLKDYLFFSDSDGAALHFENAAAPLDPSSDPCSPPNQKASPLKVELQLEQPQDMVFIEPRGLAEETFFLYPGEERDIPVMLRRLLEHFNIDPAKENRLLGATLALRGTIVNPETGTEVVVFEFHSIYLYRLFDIADADHIDGTLDFERTLADAGGGVVRDKPLVV